MLKSDLKHYKSHSL